MKRFVSLTLAICLIMSLLPAVTVASAEAADFDVASDYFWFSANSHGLSERTQLYNISTLKSNVKPEGTNKEVSDKWGFVNQIGSSDYIAEQGYLRWTHKHTAAPAFPSDTSALVFETEFDTAGTLSPEVTFITETSGGIYDVYLIEKPANTAVWDCETPVSGKTYGNLGQISNSCIKTLSPSSKIGTFDAYGTGDTKTERFSDITVSKKSYYLIFVANGANENWALLNGTHSSLKLVSFALSEIAPASEREELCYKFNSDVFDEKTLKLFCGNALSDYFVKQDKISWKNITQKFDEETQSLVPCESYCPMYLDKTSPYAIENKIPGANTNYPRIDSVGITSVVFTSYFKNADFKARPHLAVRIYIPAAGKYELGTWNGHNIGDKSENCSLYGLVTKAYFGKAPAAYDAAFINEVKSSYAYLGCHDSRIGSSSEDCTSFTPVNGGTNIIDVPAAGEYYVVFEADSESLTRNPTTNGGTPWQFLDLSGIKLTPVDETKPKATELDLSRYAMQYTDKTVPGRNWRTYGFDIVFSKTTDYQARATSVVTVNKTPTPVAQLQLFDASNVTWKDSTAENKYKTMFTVRKNFDAAGYYGISMQGFKWYAGSDFAVYVNGKYAGDYNCYADSSSIVLGEKKALNTLYIPKGYSEISFRARKCHYYMPNFLPYKVCFEPVKVDALTVSDVESDAPQKIIIGTTTVINAKVKMSDGSLRGFGLNNNADEDTDNTVAVSTGIDSAFSAQCTAWGEPEKEQDIVIEVTGVKLGTSDLTINVKTDGITFTKTIPLTVIPVPKLASVEISAEKTSLPATRKTSASVKLIGNDETEWKGETAVKYTSSDPEVASVDETSGEITAKKEGSAEITVTATSGDVTVSDALTITVTPAPILAEISAGIEIEKHLVGENDKITVSGIMDDGEAADNMEKYAITYKSSDPDIVSVDDDGTVTTHKAGDVLLNVMIENENGKLLSENVKLSVYDVMPATTIDFSKSVTRSDRTYPDITPGYKIVTEESNPVSYRMYYYPDSNKNFLHIYTRASMWPGSSDPNNSFVFTTEIPYEYDYSIRMLGGKSYAGGDYSVFIDDVYIGDHSFWDGTVQEDGILQSTDEIKVFNTVHLTAGTHKISFHCRAKYYRDPYILINEMSFVPVQKSGTAFAKTIGCEIPSEMAVGEIITGYFYPEMTDGTAYHFGILHNGKNDTASTAAITSASPAIAPVSGFKPYTVGITGKLPFTLTGASEGSAELSMSVNVNGEIAEKKQTVTVKNDPLSEIELSIPAEEIFKEDTVDLIAKAKLESGREIDRKNAPITFTSDNTSVVEISGDSFKALSVGNAKITASATFNGKTVSKSINITVLPEGMTDVNATSGGSEHIRLSGNESDKYPLYVTATTNLGNPVDMDKAEVSAKSLTPEIAELSYELYPDANGVWDNYITPKSTGTAKFEVTVKIDGRSRTKIIELPVVNGKTKATYLTEEKRDNARENIKKYAWAKSSEKSSVALADKYVDHLDEIYDLIASQGVPRSFCVGGEDDPEMYYCRYCGENLQLKYGNYPWLHSPLTRPWKIQCPACKRYFPSNDFGSFYKLGLNEYGEFDRQRALDKHAELFGDKSAEPGSDEYYGYGKGYLKNILYPEIADVSTINCGKGLRDGETVEKWGVDDGFGYVPKNSAGEPYMYSAKVTERHGYIAEYMHYGVFSKPASGSGGVLYDAIGECSKAYFYTGEIKYGRVAAILLDRLADFYPDYDISVFGDNVWNSDGGTNRGKRLGCIWESGHIEEDIRAYDRVFDVYDDPFVVNYLQNKSKTIKMRHSKQTPSQIRQNVEDGLIRTAFEGLIDVSISGNFGFPQCVNAVGAIVLDSMPETKQWLDYLMAPGWTRSAPCVGGGVNEVLINEIDSDGQGSEASSYNVIWLTSIGDINEMLRDYDGYESADLCNNPKYVQMQYAMLPVYASSNYSVQIGDTGSTCGNAHWIEKAHALEAFRDLGDPLFAQVLYMLNGNSAEGLHYYITDKNPERLKTEVQNIIDEYGTFELSSNLMPGFGYAILRDGANKTVGATDATATETTRNIWMYFGSNGGHGHRDTLNIGMTAFGLNIMPDLGYPENTGSDPNRIQWVSSTVSHNTVMVDEIKQKINTDARGKVLHYDNTDMVKLIDVDANYVYDSADAYRRSLIMVNVDNENSYYVDLFRILGGNDHLLSTHFSSDSIYETSGLELEMQGEDGTYKGSYAGIDVPYGNDPLTNPSSSDYPTQYPIGYTWLENIDRDGNPSDKFEIDFEITDFNHAIRDGKDIHVKMTMLEKGNKKSGVESSVSIADGYPPKMASNKNIDKLKYVLVKHSGEDLDTTFTTVYEPYRKTSFIDSVEELETVIKDGSESKNDTSRAIKVMHKSGRCDYIFYATNNTVTYHVSDDGNEIDFRGFAGVYTVSDGKNIYKYVCDGDIIGENTGENTAVSGVVVDFTKELSFENTIEFIPTSSVSDSDLKSMPGRVAIVETGAEERDGAYVIESAEKNGEKIVLNLGRSSLIREYVDMFNPDKGYKYVITAGSDITIPLSSDEDFSPIFENLPEKMTATAGGNLELKMTAESPLGERIVKYEAAVLPRGASLDETSGKIIWKPDSSQIGKNNFVITAIDESGRRKDAEFTVTVYGSTTGGGGGGAGGGGGGGTTPQNPDDGKKDDDNTGDNTGDNQGDNTGDNTGDKWFIDVPTDSWFYEPIKYVFDNGIMNGMSEEIFAPNTRVNRGMFVTVLYRMAGEPDVELTDKFTDVAPNAYYAKAVAWASEKGVVKGVSETEYAPNNDITREQMAAMLYRNAQANGEDVSFGEVKKFADTEKVSEYAKDAVSYCIARGLIAGKTETEIKPQDFATRAEVATILMRILKNK